MIRSWLLLDPADGDYTGLVDFFRAERTLERSAAMPGCVSAELVLPRTGDGPAVATALWESAAAYQAWVDDPTRNAGGAALGALLTAPIGDRQSGVLFDVALAAGAAGAPRSGSDPDAPSTGGPR